MADPVGSPHRSRDWLPGEKGIMRVRMGPAKREGNHRLIFDQELSGRELASPSDEEVAISIAADPLHRKSGYRDNSRYRYEIVLSAREVERLMKQIAL
jgi:hypothetical protein